MEGEGVKAYINIRLLRREDPGVFFGEGGVGKYFLYIGTYIYIYIYIYIYKQFKVFGSYDLWGVPLGLLDFLSVGPG